MSRKTDVDPGAGYRLLEDGERVVNGDEYYHSTREVWVKSEWQGRTVNPGSSTYRRKAGCHPARCDAGATLENPPLGLRPRAVADAERLAEVTTAIHRYIADDRPIPAAWVAEFIELSK